MNYVKDYAEKVISGEILAGKKVILAAKRFINDLERQEDDDFEYALPSEELSPEERVVLYERTRELQERIKSNLSDFELQVLRQYLRGASYREIANSLDKSEKSVDNAIMRIRNKLKFLEEK